MASTSISRGPASVPPDDVIFGSSYGMRLIQQKVVKLAAADVPVLMLGESGTGKDVLARLIHRLSPWSSGPFVKVNCPAIPATLLESELFGYEKGAFTGAYGVKPGRVEMAHRGSLFLDEIADLDLGLQAKLLQVLQDGQFCRIGAEEDKKVEVRVICATNRDLQRDVDTGAFRPDLFYRISVAMLRLLPLRERKQDIPQLVDYFLESLNSTLNTRAKPLSREMISTLQEYHWPGNIRELENLMRRYVILRSEDVIANELVGRKPGMAGNAGGFLEQIPTDGSLPLKAITREALRQVERHVILKVLQANGWNRKRAAATLKISYRALLYKIRQTGLPRKRRTPQVIAASAAAGKPDVLVV